MKIAFFTEARYYGKVEATNPNMRVDLAWVHLLNADHFYLYDFSDSVKYDIGVIIIPKNRVDVPIDKIKKCCKKVAIMQEGPCDYWTDYTLSDQIQHLTLLNSADFILAHNTVDQFYFHGLTGKNCYIMPSVLVESLIDSTMVRLPRENRKAAIIGGNMCHWYNGMVSFIIAKKFNPTHAVYAPSMGRKIPGEERIDGLKHLPYMTWINWMQSLNEFAVGVHMMPTVAAGTFSLNCAYLGIPCIGNEQVDTQLLCHPQLSVDLNNISLAIKLIERLRDDDDFYNSQRQTAIDEYHNNFHSSIFITNMMNIFKIMLDEK